MKKIEWSKLISAIVTALFGGFSLWSIYEYYSLSYFAIATGAAMLPDPTIAVTCITVVIGALLSYFLYQFGLKNSRNKYGVDSEGNPFKQKLEEHISDIPEVLLDNTDIDKVINEIDSWDFDTEAKG